MNKLKELFKNISDTELKLAIEEIRTADDTDGIISSEGVVRKYARLSGEITNGETLSDFLLVQVNLLKEASFRWVKINNK